ncbi:hypothetical protein [Sediminibacterium salmoneum]|uniref:hypothetical protein n=1 Tax=Sediminibacterium salmoneum TaxID=426421 RepID=UPI00047C6AC6|nr:hypothetical protein [Sediminibacterium salmoneum]
MKKWSYLTALLIILLVIHNSCSPKKELDIQENYDQIIDRWITFEKKKLNSIESNNVDEIKNNISFDGVKKIVTKNDVHLYIFYINKLKNQFLVLQKNEKEVTFRGIYLTNEMENIENALCYDSISPNTQLIKFGLDRRPIEGWSTYKNKKIKYSSTNSLQKYPKEAIQRVYRNTTTNDCKNFYWVTWNQVTGEILSVQFLYNSCDYLPVIDFINPGIGIELSGGNSLDGSISQPCIDDYNELVQDFHNVVDNSVTTNNFENIYTEIATGSSPDLFHWNPNPWTCFTPPIGSWKLVSIEKGLTKRIANNKRAFHSLEHVEIRLVGSEPPAIGIEFSSGIGTPSFTQQYANNHEVTSAAMELSFSITFTFKPVGNCFIIKDLVSVFVTPRHKNIIAYAGWNLNSL